MSAKYEKTEELIEEAVKNIRVDRATVDTVLVPALQTLIKEPHNDKLAFIVAKYMESMNRSNEQLIKLISTLNLKRAPTHKISDDEKNDIFDKLQNDKEEI